MRAREVMTGPVVAVTPDTPLTRAARLLTEHGFTALPVTDDTGRLIAVLSETDLGPAGAADRTSGTVGAVMSEPAVSVAEDADLAELVALLEDGKLRALPVVRDGRPVGMVARRDVVRALSRDDADLARDVRRRLLVYGGPGRWTVRVDDGVVRILDEYDDATDRHVARLLAESVPGVVRAEVAHRAEDGGGN